MRALKPFLLSIPLLILFLIIFSSCKNSVDSDITSPPDLTFDSARFNYKTIDGGYYNYSVWFRDTNDFFTTGESTPSGTAFNIRRYYNGIGSEISYGDFMARAIGGSDANNGYVAGTTRNADSSLIRVRKWNGAAFNEISISNNVYIKDMDCFFTVPDVIWFFNYARTNKTFRFDGTTLSQYSFNNDSLYLLNIYFDSTVQKERAVCLKYYLGISTDLLTYLIYDFNGSGWTKTGELLIPRYDSGNLRTQFINGYLLGGTKRELKLYNNGFTNFINSNNFDFANVFGYSKTNIMAQTESTGYYHWNGIRWSKEPASVWGGFIYPVSDRAYILITNNATSNSSTITLATRR